MILAGARDSFKVCRAYGLETFPRAGPLNCTTNPRFAGVFRRIATILQYQKKLLKQLLNGIACNRTIRKLIPIHAHMRNRRHAAANCGINKFPSVEERPRPIKLARDGRTNQAVRRNWTQDNCPCAHDVGIRLRIDAGVRDPNGPISDTRERTPSSRDSKSQGRHLGRLVEVRDIVVEYGPMLEQIDQSAGRDSGRAWRDCKGSTSTNR